MSTVAAEEASTPSWWPSKSKQLGTDERERNKLIFSHALGLTQGTFTIANCPSMRRSQDTRQRQYRLVYIAMVKGLIFYSEREAWHYAQLAAKETMESTAVLDRTFNADEQ